MIVMLEAVPATYRADVSRVDLASLRQDYSYYSRLKGGCGEPERAEDSSGFDLDAFFPEGFVLVGV